MLCEVEGLGKNVILGIDYCLIKRDPQACAASIDLCRFCVRADFLRENLFPFLWVIFCPLISALDALK